MWVEETSLELPHQLSYPLDPMAFARDGPTQPAVALLAVLADPSQRALARAVDARRAPAALALAAQELARRATTSGGAHASPTLAHAARLARRGAHALRAVVAAEAVGAFTLPVRPAHAMAGALEV